MFLSHGFSEHLGLYNEIGTLLGKSTQIRKYKIHESDCLQERGGWLCLVMIILVTERVTAVEPTLRMLIIMLMM